MRSLRRDASDDAGAGFTSAGRRDSAYERCCWPGVGKEQAARMTRPKTHRMGRKMAQSGGYKKRLKAAPPEGGACFGGERGIRTPDTLAGTPDFESGAFSR